MWAFALEENGDYGRAAAAAREVLQEDPTGVCAGVVVVVLWFVRDVVTPPFRDARRLTCVCE